MDHIKKYEFYSINESISPTYENFPKKFKDELTRPVKDRFQQMNPHEINDILLVLLKIDHLCKNHNYNWSDLAKRGSISNLSHLDTNQILQVLKKWYEFLIDQILFRDFNEKIEPTWSIRHNTR